MYPSNHDRFSVTLDSLLEVETLNDAVGRLTTAVDPELVPGIEADMTAVRTAADQAGTFDNAYTLLTGETTQSPDIVVSLTPNQVEIARLALIFAAREDPEAVGSDFYAAMAEEMQATAEMRNDLNS